MVFECDDVMTDSDLVRTVLVRSVKVAKPVVHLRDGGAGAKSRWHRKAQEEDGWRHFQRVWR